MVKNLILAYDRGWHRSKCLKRALKYFGENVQVTSNSFEEIIKKGIRYDKIWSMSESFLITQARLEQHWKIDNLSISSASILSDKKKFDDHCIKIGLGHMIPESVIPTEPNDLNIFENKPFILKPIIGSGCKEHLKVLESVPPEKYNYISFNNKNDFLDCLKEDNCEFFEENKKGKRDSSFNNMINKYMAQEHIHDENDSFCPYYYVNSKGEVKDILWVKLTMKTEKIDEKRFKYRNVEVKNTWKKEVPKILIEIVDDFMSKLSKSLNLKNIFFAGPDLFFHKNTYKIIDCNPRIGQGLQILDDIHDRSIVRKVIMGHRFEHERLFWWVPLYLKPGKIKLIKSDMSHFRKYFTETNLEIKKDLIIPEFKYITMEKDKFRASLKLTGKSWPELEELHQAITLKIQNSIEYY